LELKTKNGNKIISKNKNKRKTKKKKKPRGKDEKNFEKRVKRI